MRFSSKEVELVAGIARDATAGRTFQERVQAVTDALQVLIPSTSLSAILLEARPRGDPTRHMVLKNVRPESGPVYVTHYVAVDPMNVMRFPPEGALAQLSDFVRDSKFAACEYTADFLSELGIRHILASSLPMPGQDRLAIALHRERGRRDFSKREREILRLVAPDLARAAFGALLQEKLDADVPAPGRGGSAGSGAMIFDALGDVLHADRGARAILALLGDGTGAPADAFVADVRRLASIGTREGVVLERTLPLEDGRWLRVRFSPMASGEASNVLGVLEVLTPGMRELFDALCERARLTPRERVVAELAVQGLSSRGIAAKLEITVPTVNVHLAHVFAKTGTSSRMELAALLLGTGANPPLSSARERVKG